MNRNSTRKMTRTNALTVLQSWRMPIMMIAVGLVLNGCVHRPLCESSSRPMVGAIRWDAWHGDAGLSPEARAAYRNGQTPLPPGLAVERSLGPEHWHYRLPFYAKVISENEVEIHSDSQEVMDREIDYASRAGLDYWAFLTYAPASPMGLSLKFYLSSARKSKIRFCMICHHIGDHAEEIERIVGYMKDPQYVTVRDGRPLVYVFQRKPEKTFYDGLIEAAMQAGLKRPYLVNMGYGSGQVTFDAVSSYSGKKGGVGGADCWNAWKEEGRKVIPSVSAGWDVRPRAENPVPWSPEQGADLPRPIKGGRLRTAEQAAVDIAAGVRAALKWNRENPTTSEANAVIIYAWNEFDEGGWICPTLSEGTNRLDAIRRVLTARNSAKVPLEVAQWRRAEIVLTSDRDYPNPFADVTLTATFRNGETTITRPAFWDGERTWRLRFAPTELGKWTWRTTCSDPDNKGLHNRRGTLTCISYVGDNPNYVHGFVRVSPNHRYFVRADGTPFFWLGDTHWMMADHERLDANNSPDADGRNQFTQLLEDRLGKKFTVYQNYFAGHYRHWWQDREYACIDPTRFREVLDPMLDQLADRGFVIAQGIGLYKTSIELPRESLVRLAEYVAARYGAHPLVWFTGQEVNLPAWKDKPLRTDLDAWRAAAERFAFTNGYGHPVSGHMFPTNPPPAVWGQEPWHDWFAVQGGHTSSGIRTLENFRFYWDYIPRKPFLETEAMYEAIKCGPRVATPRDVRHAAWKSLLCGSYGYTYGAAAVWLFRWDHDDPTGKSYNPDHCWYEGMRLPGSTQMTHLRTFFEQLEWWKLVPRFADPAWCEFADPETTVLATEDNRLYVVYAYGRHQRQGTLHGLAAGEVYSAWWFDPRRGTRYPIANDIVPADEGKWTLPLKPSPDDWVLLLRRGRDPDEDIAGPPLPDGYGPGAGDLPLFAFTSASATDFKNGYHPDETVDGIAEHPWNGWSANAGEYLQFTFEDPVSIARIVVHTQKDYELRDYTIEIQRGDQWETVVEVKGNTDICREHAVSADNVHALRLHGLLGPERQPEIVRVTELEVFPGARNTGENTARPASTEAGTKSEQ